MVGTARKVWCDRGMSLLGCDCRRSFCSCVPVNMENWWLVISEPVEFGNWPIDVQDLSKYPQSFYKNLWNTPKVIKNNRKIATCNRLDLETLGCWPIMPKHLPKHRCVRAWTFCTPKWCVLTRCLLGWTLERHPHPARVAGVSRTKEWIWKRPKVYPHLLVQANSERWVPALVATNDFHWLNQL